MYYQLEFDFREFIKLNIPALLKINIKKINESIIIEEGS